MQILIQLLELLKLNENPLGKSIERVIDFTLCCPSERRLLNF
jgi:hypothetical protein